MCGILGFFGKPENDSPEHIIKSMSDSLCHRGPDMYGVWSNTDSHIYFGHRRLSIIDLSEDGSQPMTSQNGRYTLIYNGEIYNFQTLRNELKEQGVSFKGHSDTEVLLSCIEVYGVEETLQKIRGMFAFALWDSHEKSLHLARDHFGKKPLYIGWAGKSLVFASELKPIMTHPDFQKRVRDGSKSLYMTYGYIPAPNTIFEDVWQLPPAHHISLTLNDIEQQKDLPSMFKPYWSAEEAARSVYQTNKDISEPKALEKLDRLLTESVLRRMVSDVPLGSFLSGGIDSSLITAVMQSQSTQNIQSFSIGFEEQGVNEAPFAKKVAKHLGTDHHELYISANDALSVIEKLPQIYDEPFADISSLPTYLLSQFARQNVTVALSGDGGDELLGGYTRHVRAPEYFQKIQNLPTFLQKIIVQTLNNVPLGLKNKYIRSFPFLEETEIKNVFQRLLELSPIQSSWTFRNGSYETYALESFTGDNLTPTDMMILGDVFHTLPNKFLTKVDRASMANSLEVRSPFLDLELFDFAWSLPQSMKIRNHQGKWLMRQLLEKYLPSELFERPKQGFNIPLSKWLHHDLRDWAEDFLNETELTQNGFQADKIQNAWQDHQKGLYINTDKLWAVCQYQQWARQWL